MVASSSLSCLCLTSSSPMLCSTSMIWVLFRYNVYDNYYSYKISIYYSSSAAFYVLSDRTGWPATPSLSFVRLVWMSSNAFMVSMAGRATSAWESSMLLQSYGSLSSTPFMKFVNEVAISSSYYFTVPWLLSNSLGTADLDFCDIVCFCEDFMESWLGALFIFYSDVVIFQIYILA